MTAKKTDKIPSIEFAATLPPEYTPPPAPPIITALTARKTKKTRPRAKPDVPTHADAPAKAAEKTPEKKPGKKSRAPVYIYWALIVLAVMGACHLLTKRGAVDNVEIVDSSMPAEEPLDAGADEASSNDYHESGKQRLLSGDNVGALNDFTIAIERDPRNSLNYIYRGEVLMAGSNFDAAIQDFDSAIRLNPEAVVAYYDRALANIKLERLDAAKSDLDSALAAYAAVERLSRVSQTDMAKRDIFAKRAQVNLWLRNWIEAESDYTAAIASNYGDPEWDDYTGRAEARTNKGDFSSAINDYVSAVTIISEKIQKTPDEKTRENMSRQAMGYFEKSGALRVKVGQMDLALQDLQAAHTLAIALNDMENKNRLQVLMNSIN